ncbi:exonuclease, partial [Escherichia coli 93.0055]
SRWFMQ